ncbi:MAG: CRISPR-associated endonuclease Cas1 [Deltaproteobacteria bacterium]|nr:CRISPR-associated endonuclease Cas1 [Deltaproteobacteria bacterium]MBW2065543.1 CRISPR-associated endonuclease Cas1 [Deltaproteobacteria bacterium]
MAVAYVLEQNTFIRLEGERFIIQRKRDILHTLHIYKLDQLVLFGNVSITPPALQRLLSEGIDTIFMSRNGKYKGRLQPPLSKNITLRCDQFDKLRNNDFCLDMARAIVNGKIANMRTVLMRLNRSREGLGLEDHIIQVKNLLGRVPDATDLDSLRGLEGKASAVYFEGFSRGFIDQGITRASVSTSGCEDLPQTRSMPF